MASKGSLPAYLGGGMPALGYFPDFMPGQQGALASQLAAGYQAPTTNPVLDGLKKDGYAGSRSDFLYHLGGMYSPMGSAVPKPAPKPATKTVARPLVVAPKPVAKKKVANPTMPAYPRYVSSRW